MLKFLIIMPMMVFVAGCSPLKIPGPPPDLYNLTPKSTFNDNLPDIRKQLIIEEPIAAGGREVFARA